MRWVDKIISFWTKKSSPRFLTREEIVEDLLVKLTKEDRNYIATCTEQLLILLHHTFGQFIRNKYHLWHPDNPLTKGCESGTDPRHPDNLSQDIIVDVWERLGGGNESN